MTLHATAQHPAESSADGFFTRGVGQSDPALAAVLSGELRRQQDQIELIASENIVSRAVLDAQGSVLTNKYAEGYPGKRYYGGCEVVDEAETLAIERARQLFGCEFANVQPQSGIALNASACRAGFNPVFRVLFHPAGGLEPALRVLSPERLQSGLVGQFNQSWCDLGGHRWLGKGLTPELSRAIPRSGFGSA